MRLLLLVLASLAALAQEVPVGRGLRGEPAVAAGNGQFVAVWTDGVQLQARRFAGDGTALDAEPLVVGQSANAVIAVAFDGLEYLIAWSDTVDTYHRVQARFLSATGGLASRTLTLHSGLADTQWPPAVSVAWNGVDFVAAWSETLVSGNASLHAALVRADRGVVKKALIADGLWVIDRAYIATGPDRDLILYSGQYAQQPNAAYEAVLEGTVVDRDLGVLAAVRIDLQNGTHLGCFGTRFAGGQQAVWNGNEWLVTWQRGACFGSTLHLGRVSRGGEVSPAQQLTAESPGVFETDLLMLGGEPVLVTEFLKHGQANDPVYLDFLSRNVTPRMVLRATAALDATVLDTHRLLLVYRGGEGVMATIQIVAPPGTVRRRAVR